MFEVPDAAPRRSWGHGARTGSRVTREISAEIVALYATVCGHDRTTATTYITDNVVLCVLESILGEHEATLIDAGSSGAVIDARVAFQAETEDEFTEAIERLTGRRVVAFMSANQTTPGVAAELFLLDAAPSDTTPPSGQCARRTSPRIGPPPATSRSWPQSSRLRERLRGAL